jgi:hypothetical protein
MAVRGIFPSPLVREHFLGDADKLRCAHIGAIGKLVPQKLSDFLFIAQPRIAFEQALADVRAHIEVSEFPMKIAARRFDVAAKFVVITLVAEEQAK